MIILVQRISDRRRADAQLVLPFELRQKSRFRTTLSNGEEVGVNLDRGQVLRDGDLLLASDGRIVAIVAAPEVVSIVTSADPLQLARAAYHLGNRHVAVEIAAATLCYLHDHVLDEMVRGLGLEVTEELRPFEPEGGAYAAHSHSNVLLRALPHA